MYHTFEASAVGTMVSRRKGIRTPSSKPGVILLNKIVKAIEKVTSGSRPEGGE